MAMGLVRGARVFSISFLVLVHYLYNNNLVGNKNNTQTTILEDDKSNDDNVAPEASLPEHHVPLEWDPIDALPTITKSEALQSNDNATINNKKNSNTPPSIWFDAIDTYGNRGYVADPTLFRKLVLQWHDEHENATYWDRIRHFQSHLLLDPNFTSPLAKEPLTAEFICSITESNGGGNELNDNSVKMLMNIKIDTPTPVLRRGCTESPPLQNEHPRLFCGIYTHGPARDFTRLTALSYGWKCDGFLAFSSVTIPSLGMVGLLHRGPESYDNMVQKTRSIWAYVAEHYLDRYDYFHIGGDDMHLIVENFRSLLLEYESNHHDRGDAAAAADVAAGKENQQQRGRIFGQVIPNGKFLFLRGGAGYTLDRVALKKLAEYMPDCGPKVRGSWEDNIVSKCAYHLGLTFGDNRDSCTGQQRSHTETPGRLYNANADHTTELGKNYRVWANRPHPVVPEHKTGFRVGMEAASNHSVTFHRLRYPPWMVRHHALLYRACPGDTPLGQSSNERYDSITAGGA